MLIVDKRKSDNRLIVTVTEFASGLQTGYKLKVHSTYTNKSYSVILPENTSSHKFRFDEFIVSTSLLQQWEVGSYSYTIIEMIGEAEGKVAETGVLQVIDGVTEYVTPEQNEEDDDYIVYNG